MLDLQDPSSPPTGSECNTRPGEAGASRSIHFLASAATVTLDIADANDGSSLGTYRTASIAAGGQAILPVATIETGATPKIVPGTRNHYVITATAFSGYLQHQLNNSSVGVVTDMTTTCGLQP